MREQWSLRMDMNKKKEDKTLKKRKTTLTATEMAMSNRIFYTLYFFSNRWQAWIDVTEFHFIAALFQKKILNRFELGVFNNELLNITNYGCRLQPVISLKIFHFYFVSISGLTCISWYYIAHANYKNCNLRTNLKSDEQFLFEY